MARAKTTIVKGVDRDTKETVISYKLCNGFWLRTYVSNGAFDYFDNWGVPDKKVKRLMDVEKIINSSSALVCVKQANEVLFTPSNRERARVYSQSRKNYNNKKLAVWMTPDDFNRIAFLKKKLHATGQISKPTNEAVVRHCLKIIYMGET